MIEVKDLSRRFGQIQAVDRVSFEVESGNITGFLGPNGAGKTTTLRMMVGFLQPDKGDILINGQSIFEDPIRANAQIGYLPEHNPLYDEMYVIEALKYVASLRGLSDSFYKERKDFVVSNCGLSEVKYQKISTLSKGYRQRLGLAQALLHDPQILILDEPTSGLDPNQIVEIRELIRSLGKAKTLIFSSHILQEVQALCDRVLIINKGQIIVDSDIHSLNQHLGDQQVLELELYGTNICLDEFIKQYPQLHILAHSLSELSGSFSLRVPAEMDIRLDLARFIAENGWQILAMHSKQKTLEESFQILTRAKLDTPEQEPEEDVNPKPANHATQEEA